MAVLGQSAPAAATDTDVYTVPQKTLTVARVFVTNRHASAAATYRLALRPAGAALANQHYLVYERSIAAGADHHSAPFEIGETDVVTVRASSADLSFTLTGVEEPERE